MSVAKRTNGRVNGRVNGNGAATDRPTERAEIIPPHGRGRLLAPWKPGQSGNPSGVVDFNAVAEARSICAAATPDAARKQVALLNSDDDRIVFMATEAILTRGGVKPLEKNEQRTKVDLSTLSAGELDDFVAMLKRVLGR